MMHTDRCTHIRFKEDKDILIRENFNVNIRLFKANKEYKELVLKCCDYIRTQALTTVDGYKKPHGYSGANAGIPFKIIALADGTVMINPKYTPITKELRQSESNCGSLTLENPISIWRWDQVLVEYIDEQGVERQMKGYLPTVQHEVDHCNGVLITDRTEKDVLLQDH